MEVVRIDLNPDGGGVLIEGSNVELYDLGTHLVDASSDFTDDEVVGSLLTADGVETVTVRCTHYEPEEDR